MAIKRAQEKGIWLFGWLCTARYAYLKWGNNEKYNLKYPQILLISIGMEMTPASHQDFLVLVTEN